MILRPLWRPKCDNLCYSGGTANNEGEVNIILILYIKRPKCANLCYSGGTVIKKGEINPLSRGDADEPRTLGTAALLTGLRLGGEHASDVPTPGGGARSSEAGVASGRA